MPGAPYKTLYCSSRFQRCKRYDLASQAAMPEPDLLPDGSRTAPDATG